MEALLENRIPMANLPTPVQLFSKLSKKLGIELFIKRDDLTESVASGNKLRKLEYLLWDAKKKGADTLISVGGIQSNHCRAVAWVAANQELDCLLLLRGTPTESIQGNLLIDRLLGARVKFYTPVEFKNINKIGEQVCIDLEKEGKRPYYILLGGSNAIGSLGYVRMIKEIVESKNEFDHIYCATGSGGTLAGIMLGCQHYQLKTKVHGIAVCDDNPYFVEELTRIQQEFKSQYHIDFDLTGVDQCLDDQHIGQGYALNTREELQELYQYALAGGLVLDPVYTLKAFLGMAAHIRQGMVKPGERVLFVHSGGHYGLFSKFDELGRLFE